MRPLTVGGICVGYGGLETAISRLVDIRHTWHAENNPAASKVLTHYWPEAPNHGDVTLIDWTALAPIDVLAGGVPCQGYSSKGKGLGGDDDRDLWPVRKTDAAGNARRGMVDAIDVLQPPLVVLENVDQLVNSGGGANFATILTDLRVRGYAVAWTVVGACRVGAAHHRHRTFLAACKTAVGVPMSDPVAHANGSGWEPVQQVLFGEVDAPRWPLSGLMVDGSVWALPADTCDDSLRLLPTVLTSEANGPGQHGTGGMDLRTTVSLLDPEAVGHDRFGPFAAAVRRHERAYGLVAPAPQVRSADGGWQLSALFTEFMQGLAPGFLTDLLTRAEAIVRAGNGVNALQAAFALQSLPTFRAAVRELTAEMWVAA
jgi:DNA (cytosine-5)-methyltransferase 1